MTSGQIGGFLAHYLYMTRTKRVEHFISMNLFMQVLAWGPMNVS